MSDSVSNGLRPVYVGVGKIHLTEQSSGDRYIGSLCGRMATGRGYNFFVSLSDSPGACKFCLAEADRRKNG